MQNQDPTADVDPNSYIDQLVQVNSLEQLISINQNLETVLGSASAQSSPSEAGRADATASSPHGKVSGASGKVTGAPMSAHHSVSASAPSRAAARGNLSVPQATPASHTVARSLDGTARPGAGRHAIRDIPTRPLQR
jgi:flagellar basal-body rod modification protein FlgD